MKSFARSASTPRNILYGILYEIIKKHERVRKGAKGMDFNNYTSRILTIKEAEEGSRRFAKKTKTDSFSEH